jgi:hypothetical protein
VQLDSVAASGIAYSTEGVQLAGAVEVADFVLRALDLVEAGTGMGATRAAGECAVSDLGCRLEAMLAFSL